MKKIAVLSTAPSVHNESYDVAEFEHALNARLSKNFSINTILFSDLLIRINPKTFSIKIMPSNKDLAEYDFVFFKSWVRLPELAHVVTDYLITNSIPFEPKELEDHHSHGKLSESVTLFQERYIFPDTLFTISPKLLKEEYEKLKIEKVIVKDADAFGGQDNHLVNNKNDLKKVLQAKSEINYIMQPFIPNKNDYRIFIMDDQKPLIIKRIRKESSHLNNTSMGADAVLCDIQELGEDIINKSINLSKKLKRSFAGVDVLAGDDGQFYFLEVNKSPQVASGAFVDGKIKLFADGLAGMVIRQT